jgi:CDP-diacylglycerol---glycerol-3-phosphate 3-phosphatidyltransferase
MNASNILTLSRIPLAAVATACLLWAERCEERGAVVVSSIVLGAALIAVIANLFTDYWDGALARRNKDVSDFGKVMDPFTDAVFYIAVFACYMERGWMPSLLFLIILARELFMNLSLRPLLAARGVVLSAGPWGKAKTVVQGVATITAITLEILSHEVAPQVFFLEWLSEDVVRIIAVIFFAIAAALSAFSFGVYLLGVRKAMMVKAAEVEAKEKISAG